MPAKLITNPVGPWPMNSYVLICEETNTSAIIDPGADAEDILASIVDTKVSKILITHGHYDHTNALAEVKAATSAPVYLHPADGKEFEVEFDIPLKDGDMIEVGNQRLRAIHVPGHTPGQMCFDLGDYRIVLGDTVFVNGPGATRSPEDFTTTMNTMQKIVFAWSDKTEFYPGHGPNGKIGEERPAFETFVAKGWPSDLKGDVTWK